MNLDRIIYSTDDFLSWFTFFKLSVYLRPDMKRIAVKDSFLTQNSPLRITGSFAMGGVEKKMQLTKCFELL